MRVEARAKKQVTKDHPEPKLTEKVFQDKENLYKFLLDNSKEIILVLSKKGKILFANKTTLDNFGYSEEEIIGQSITHFLTKDSIRRSLSALAQEFLGHSQPEMEVKAKTKLGEIRYLKVALGSAPIYDKGKLIGVMVCGSDMTALRKTEEELREKEERFRELWDHAPVAYHTLDINGIITDVNQTEARMLGYAKEEMVGQSIFAFILPEQRAEARRRFQQKISGQKISRAESRMYVKKDGSKVWVAIDDALERDKDGEVISVRTTMVDITEQKEAEKTRDSVYRISEAAHSAQNLEELFHSIHHIIEELMPAKNFYIALYDHDRGILSFPYFADEYDEAPPPTRLGKGLTEYVLRTGEPLLASPEVFKKLIREGEAELIGTSPIDWLGVPLKTENKTFGVLAVKSYAEGVRFGEKDKEILKLVSAQTAMAIRRKHAEKQLKESLREKEVLLQEIHHRVKNNMQIISSLLNLQAGQMKDTEFIKMVKESQSRIRSIALVHEKLYKSQDFSNINFSDYVQSLVVHLFQFNQVNSNLIQLKMNLEDVFLDLQTAIPCGLILNELITNSLRHAFPEGRGGEIMVELHRLEEHTFQIMVKDNGVGIPKDLDFRNATSMGWQIVTILVNQLEGSLEVQGESGTNVTIVFKELRSKSST